MWSVTQHYTGCLTLYHNFRIRFLTSHRVRHHISMGLTCNDYKPTGLWNLRTGRHKNTLNLAEDMILFTSNKVTLLQRFTTGVQNDYLHPGYAVCTILVCLQKWVVHHHDDSTSGGVCGERNIYEECWHFIFCKVNVTCQPCSLLKVTGMHELQS